MRRKENYARQEVLLARSDRGTVDGDLFSRTILGWLFPFLCAMSARQCMIRAKRGHRFKTVR
ncbi:hypothetical protein IE4771_PB00133 (plasmid) [Rhizobium etli bv. mimosae str. IE4771]|uniref:Uncharacterized protein n=1 Tax=Rhizobium etli bv. mimosae str. IE4771 TaxID=1432050 RepID=A0A060I7Y5_RHIET|nr:hypothetical protein IE4771_PB00133 [Rhizobium sp. IE4771]